MHEGSNLIAYACSTVGPVEELITNECINGILGQGIATQFINGIGWIGSLDELIPGSGYWFKSSCTTELSYDCIESSQSLTRADVEYLPQIQKYNQSTEQAFYFIENIENIEIGDVINAYNQNTLVGSRVWAGAYTDIPVMGVSNSEKTKFYCNPGSIPKFRVVKKNGEMHKLSGLISQWENNGLFLIKGMSMELLVPDYYTLGNPYPNPFNPVTTIDFSIPVDSKVSLIIYDLNGREIVRLLDDRINAGYHSITWNADSFSSGFYFVKLVSGDFIKTQKLILVK